MAKVTPGEFMRQVRTETAKVIWPTSRETMQTTLMVILMTFILAIFFFGLDSMFSGLVQFLLTFVSKG